MTTDSTARHPHPHDLAASLPKKLPDARVRYGNESPVQFADLRLPSMVPPEHGFPVVMFVHGGGWLADWSKDYATPFVEALTEHGLATWDIEFRRIGNRGGGYPGTFRDVGMAADHLREVARSYPVDVERAIAVGHSSGGHLALWLAGRHNLPSGGPLCFEKPLALKGVISLGGVNDLQNSLEVGGRTDVLDLLGVTTADEAVALFAETSPAHLLPFGIPQVLIAGTLEDDWRRNMTSVYAGIVRRAGGTVRLIEPEGFDHFDVVDAFGPGLPFVAREIWALLSA